MKLVVCCLCVLHLCVAWAEAAADCVVNAMGLVAWLRVQGWWDHLDHNNNGIVSLAEIKKFVQDKQWKVADPALMQAYKYATARGDDFVQKREFPRLLRGMVFMNRLWDLFDEMDTSDDRRCV